MIPNRSNDERLRVDAFKNLPKTVPIVVYEKDGTRRVVGEALIEAGEKGLSVTGRVTDPEVGDILLTTDPDGLSVVKPEKPDADR